MIEVIAKRDHRNNVEERDWPYWKTGDHVVVNVVLFEGSAWVYGSEGQVEKVKGYESRDEGPLQSIVREAYVELRLALLTYLMGRAFRCSTQS